MSGRTVVLSVAQARELKFDSYARYKRLAAIELAMSLGMSDAEARGIDGPFRVKVDK